MFKRLIAAAALFLIPVCSFGAGGESSAKDEQAGFNEDYFVGLKAFDDGFYDAARTSLLDFLAADGKSARAGFATYLLYQIYMAENDFKNAQQTFDKLSNFKDERFDAKKMEADRMYIAAKVDCGNAEKLLLSAVNDVWFKVYLDSGCAVTEKVVKHSLNPGLASATLYAVMDRAKDNKEYMALIYSGLPAEKRTGETLNYFGRYFAARKMMPEFWELYESYKDADMVSIALDYIWSQGDYPKYVNMFNSDAKKDYKLQSAAYCRMIEASNRNGDKFDCDIVDGCLGKTSPDFKKTKLACYMKNEDKKGINIFMNEVSSKDGEGLCEYARYMVGKNLYDSGFLGKFSGCADKGGMYEALYKAGDFTGLINLIGKNSGQTDLAYLSVAYSMAGKDGDAGVVLVKITEPQLIQMVKSRTGLSK